MMTDATQTPLRADAPPPTSKLAVAAFVLSLIPCAAPLGIILGIVSLLRIKSSHGVLRGRGFAIAAVVIPLVALPLALAAALPAFDRYQCGAAQSEAHFALRALHARQLSFHLGNQRYAKDLTELAFDLGGESRYAIRILQADADRYRADATSGADLWVVDELGVPQNTSNACE